MYTGVGRQTKRDVWYGNYQKRDRPLWSIPILLSPFPFFQKEKLPYSQNFIWSYDSYPVLLLPSPYGFAIFAVPGWVCDFAS